MPHYRIYSVTREGRIKSAPVTIDCDDDQIAIERAKSIKDGLDLEVWQERRRVAVLKSNPQGASW